MKKTKIKEIPFFSTRYYDKKTNIWIYIPETMSHADYDGQTRYDANEGKPVQINPIMLENKPFKDTLKYYEYYRGRSAAGAVFTNEVGQIFTVFMTDLDKFIPLMEKGVITGTFIYCKRGRNYGITLYEGDM